LAEAQHFQHKTPAAGFRDLIYLAKGRDRRTFVAIKLNYGRQTQGMNNVWGRRFWGKPVVGAGGATLKLLAGIGRINGVALSMVQS
jgi:hypothetical protein